MHLSMRSFNKNSEGLFCGVGPGLDARDRLRTRPPREAPVPMGLVFSAEEEGQKTVDR